MLVEETGVTRENHRPAQYLTYHIMLYSSTPHHERDSNSQL
jgi:hypothetical protein